MQVTGTQAADRLRGSRLGDTLSGEGGDDRIAARGGADTVFGGSGDDVITGGEGRDRIFGGAGDDRLYGFSAAAETPTSASITLTRIGAHVFERPVFAAPAPGDPGRLYVVEQHSGRILILDTRTGMIDPRPFLDIPDTALARGNEQGLLGLAFHPDYARNGRLFVHLTQADGDVAIVEYHRAAGDPNVAVRPNLILVIDKDNGAGNHNGGWMDFGPDGMLCVAVGDEGLRGDPANNAQNPRELWGKMLRIDVDGDDFPADGARDYAIPDDNPFVGRGAGEIWALGLRNPWRASFDRETGDLYIGDVGQAAREEIDFQPAGRGGVNYGWKVEEGRRVYDDNVPGNPPAGSPAFTRPATDYGHDAEGGFAVVGGYVNRGPSPGLQGRYLYADFVTDQLWSLRIVNGQAVDVTNHSGQIVPRGAAFDGITSFAEDLDGNLYTIGIDGAVARLDFGPTAADGGDVINGGEGDDIIHGGAGDDRLNGGATGNDRLYGEQGNDRLDGGGSGSDRLSGGYGNDWIRGGSGGDKLWGDAGADVLRGGGGGDRLSGGPGHDVLLGGPGTDLLSGGSGRDTFVFEPTSQRDTIRDFQDDYDTIRLAEAFGFATPAEALAFAEQRGADLVFTFPGGQELTILDTTAAALSDDLIV